MKALQHKKSLAKLMTGLLAMATVSLLTLPALGMSQAEVKLPFTVEGATGTVQIEAEADAPLPEVTEVTLEGDGVFVMEYTEPDDYVYVVRQIPGSETGVTYDSTEYRVLVSVVVTETGKLIPRMSLSTKGNAQKPAEIVFSNEPPEPPPPPPHRVKTGDSTQMGLYLGLLLVSGGGLFLAARGKRSAKKQ